MKRKSDNLAAAHELAKDIVAKICRCGHTDDEHLTFTKTNRCGDKGCRCRSFTAAPLKVEAARG